MNVKEYMLKTVPKNADKRQVDLYKRYLSYGGEGSFQSFVDYYGVQKSK